jgi:hypothetical protein
MSGIIYKISSDKGPKVYYGSTTQTLESRFSQHCSEYKLSRVRCSSSVLFEEYGIDNCIVEKVEEVAIQLLLERERYWIESDANSVNKNRPWVSEEEQKEDDRERYEQNKEHRNQLSREWYEKNKEHANQLSREWYEKNKDQIKERSREYYEKNKDKIKEKKKEYDRLRYLKRKASSAEI